MKKTKQKIYSTHKRTSEKPKNRTVVIVVQKVIGGSYMKSFFPVGLLSTVRVRKLEGLLLYFSQGWATGVEPKKSQGTMTGVNSSWYGSPSRPGRDSTLLHFHLTQSFSSLDVWLSRRTVRLRESGTGSGNRWVKGVDFLLLLILRYYYIKGPTILSPDELTFVLGLTIFTTWRHRGRLNFGRTKKKGTRSSSSLLCKSLFGLVGGICLIRGVDTLENRYGKELSVLQMSTTQ